MLFLDGFGGGVGGLFLSSKEVCVIMKFFASTYSYELLTILVVLLVVVVQEVVRVIVPVGLLTPAKENEFEFQSRL